MKKAKAELDRATASTLEDNGISARVLGKSS
jgi:hypothetical protein